MCQLIRKKKNEVYAIQRTIFSNQITPNKRLTNNNLITSALELSTRPLSVSLTCSMKRSSCNLVSQNATKEADRTEPGRRTITASHHCVIRGIQGGTPNSCKIKVEKSSYSALAERFNICLLSLETRMIDSFDVTGAEGQPTNNRKLQILDKKKKRGVRVLSARCLILYFHPRLRAQVICYFGLKTTSFALLTLLFTCLHGQKSRYD